MIRLHTSVTGARWGPCPSSQLFVVYSTSSGCPTSRTRNITARTSRCARSASDRTVGEPCAPAVALSQVSMFQNCFMSVESVSLLTPVAMRGPQAKAVQALMSESQAYSLAAGRRHFHHGGGDCVREDAAGAGRVCWHAQESGIESSRRPVLRFGAAIDFSPERAHTSRRVHLITGERFDYERT